MIAEIGIAVGFILVKGKGMVIEVISG